MSIGKVAESLWAKFVEAWQNLGATYLSINTMGAGLTTPQDHIDKLRYVKTRLGL
jgi:hypothetical protein